MSRLTLTPTGTDGELIRLANGQSCTIGSSSAADFKISNGDGVHCRVTCRGRHCFIECLRSALSIQINGTSVNRSAIADGDQLKIGAVEFKVEFVKPKQDPRVEVSINFDESVDDSNGIKDENTESAPQIAGDANPSVDPVPALQPSVSVSTSSGQELIEKVSDQNDQPISAIDSLTTPEVEDPDSSSTYPTFDSDKVTSQLMQEFKEDSQPKVQKGEGKTEDHGSTLDAAPEANFQTPTSMDSQPPLQSEPTPDEETVAPQPEPRPADPVEQPGSTKQDDGYDVEELFQPASKSKSSIPASGGGSPDDSTLDNLKSTEPEEVNPPVGSEGLGLRENETDDDPVEKELEAPSLAKPESTTLSSDSQGLPAPQTTSPRDSQLTDSKVKPESILPIEPATSTSNPSGLNLKDPSRSEVQTIQKLHGEQAMQWCQSLSETAGERNIFRAQRRILTELDFLQFKDQLSASDPDGYVLLVSRMGNAEINQFFMEKGWLDRIRYPSGLQSFLDLSPVKYLAEFFQTVEACVAVFENDGGVEVYTSQE